MIVTLKYHTEASFLSLPHTTYPHVDVSASQLSKFLEYRSWIFVIYNTESYKNSLILN